MTVVVFVIVVIAVICSPIAAKRIVVDRICDGSSIPRCPAGGGGCCEVGGGTGCFVAETKGGLLPFLSGRDDPVHANDVPRTVPVGVDRCRRRYLAPA